MGTDQPASVHVNAEEQIRAAALDYIAGVLEADPTRMEWKIINVLWELTPEYWASRTDKPRSSEPSWPHGHTGTRFRPR